jgi:putative phosphoribosyl transferase
MPRRFTDRYEAGRLLAQELRAYAERPDVLVLALPRGGVPVGYEIARELKVPLDVLVVRKLGVPFQPELAMGAVASGGVRVLNDNLVRELNIDASEIEQATVEARREVERREKAYRGGGALPELKGTIVLLVDDGLATGATMRAAVEVVRKLGASKIVVAVPVAPAEAVEDFRPITEDVCCLSTPASFYAIGLWYKNFPQLADAEVQDLLRQSREAQSQEQAAATSR